MSHPKETDPLPATKPARLIIVDDEAPQMKALSETLRDQGYLTRGFTSASQALAALRKEEADLVLTDLMMPEMDGIAFLRAALEIDPRLVGIVMTGHGAIDTAVEAMKAGALDYILKPFKLGAIRPVLARALAVRRLRGENEELQARVRARTAELEAANQELESFSYSVSHDLRAPLRAITAFSGMLQEDHGAVLPPEAQTLLGKIYGNAERMARLIEDLLAFSRFTRQPLAARTVNMTNLAQEVLDDLQKEQPDRRVEVRVSPLPDCLGDPSLLKQVWINLLANAFKFTRGREPALIEIGSREEPAATVYFVRDNGAGFDMKYAERLFGVFQRLHPASEFEGTGIGLSIVQRIIQRHGGRVWAEGESGLGAVFHFTLPKPAASSSSASGNV